MTIRALPHPIWLRDGSSDFEVMEQIFVHREYDFAGWPCHYAMVQRVYAEALANAKAPIIVDCGANVGFSSIWFSMKFPQAKVYAIEPEPENFAMLRRNVSCYANIIPIQAGISDRNSCLRLQGGEAWGCRTEDDPLGSVEAVTVPDVLARDSADAVLFIVKVDIEGYETALFRSNTEWTKRAPLIVVEMHDWLDAWGGTGDAVLRCLTAAPRDYLIRGENLFAFAHAFKSPVECKASPLTAA